MKVAIIGTVGLPAKYGGFETLTENLVDKLADKFDFTVYCSSKGKQDVPSEYKNVKLAYINLNANGIQSIPYDVISIFKSLKSSDSLLILGVSGCICLPLVRLISRNKKIVINIDGLEWKRQKWGRLAKTFLKLSEKLAVNYADIVVSDNMAIKDYVKSEYGKDSELIAYGGDHVLPHSDKQSSEWPQSYEKKQYAVKVCRIEPENNIDIVLEAFSKTSTLPLIVIGNWDNSNYGKALRRQYSSYTNITLLDPIYDTDKLHLIRSNAAIYVHGHSAGGTNPSLVEAMYLGLPIISFGVQYNRETTQNKAIYFNDANELIGVLNDLGGTNLEQLGETMRAIASENYNWSNIANKYAALLS